MRPQWIHAAYALTFTLGMITGGRLGDLYGRGRIFLLGTGAFTVASLLCGLAADPATLIATRAVQGAGRDLPSPRRCGTARSCGITSTCWSAIRSLCPTCPTCRTCRTCRTRLAACGPCRAPAIWEEE
ncbi:MFS transporter [Streptomyces antarcticus]|uniref:MFS transporter n=1 Tax=Streptomyces antarcticus TaxID=2996458 RepID=UPI003B833010